MKSAESTATFAANSEVNGAIRSVASSPTPIAYARRPAALEGIVRGSVIMKKRKTRTSGDVTSVHQSSKPTIGPTCHAAVMTCPLAASTPIPAAKASQNPTAIPVRCSRPRIAKPPATMIASASTSAGETGPHQKARGSARSGPSRRKQGTRPKFEGLKMWRPRNWIRYFESNAIAEVASEDPAAFGAPPVAVLGPRHAEDERDAVSGQQRARGPHEHALSPESDPDLEDRRGEHRDEDLGDRELELERDLSEHLERDDHRREVETRVARRGQQDGIRVPRICSDGLSTPTAAGPLIARSCYCGLRFPMLHHWRVAVPATRYDPLIAQLRVALPNREAPADLGAYLDKVRRHAYRITDEDVQTMKEAGHSEDEIFEHTVSAAVTAGLERLDSGLRTLR